MDVRSLGVLVVTGVVRGVLGSGTTVGFGLGFFFYLADCTGHVVAGILFNGFQQMFTQH